MMEHLTVREAARDVPVRCRADVVVCGGGPAGAAAAMAAARLGRKVVLVEACGFLGGAITAAGINGIGGWQHDLDGRPLISGIAQELMEEACRQSRSDPEAVRQVFRSREGRPSYREGGLGCYWLNINPAMMKIVLDRKLQACGVRLLLHCSAVYPILDGNVIRGVYIESKSGREAILADLVIDCTGDGDIACRAGAPVEQGEETTGLCQPGSLLFTAANADVPPLNYSLGADDESHLPPLERNRYEGAIRLARERGELTENPNELFCAATPLLPADGRVRSVNFTRLQRLCATDVESLTQAEIAGRRQVLEALDFMRKYIRGCEDAYLVTIQPQVGIRESRRVQGEYVLTGEDVLRGRRFEDCVCRGIYLLDIHNADGVGKSTLHLLDQPYDIPYRALVPLKVEGLLTAGRCISGDHTALASYRIISHCMQLGQAAGTAAALALERGCSVRSIPTAALRERLEKDGCNLGSGIS